MPSQITKINILLISPSDVENEEKEITQVIRNWNAHFGKVLNVFLELIQWKTHSVPEAGNEPQKILNKQIVSQADFGIAIFWSRLGKSTSTHESGSLEEIDELLKANKKVLIYFNEQPIPQKSLEDDQYSKLQMMKKKYLNEGGLAGFYTQISDLREKIQLNIISIVSEIISSHYSEGLAKTNINKIKSIKYSDKIKFVSPNNSTSVRISAKNKNVIDNHFMIESLTDLNKDESIGITMHFSDEKDVYNDSECFITFPKFLKKESSNKYYYISDSIEIPHNFKGLRRFNQLIMKAFVVKDRIISSNYNTYLELEKLASIIIISDQTLILDYKIKN